MHGIFWVACPRCGNELEPIDAGQARCDDCHQDYLMGLGHVLALRGHRDRESIAARPEGTLP